MKRGGRGDTNLGDPGSSGLKHLVAALRKGPSADPEGIAGAWLALRERLPPDSSFLASWAETRSDVLASADPELALSTWVRWIEAEVEEDSEAPGPAPDLGELRDAPHDVAPLGAAERRSARWASSGRFREGFIRIAGASPALGELLLSLWREFQPEVWKSGWVTRGLLGRRLAQATSSLSETEFMAFTRRFQRLESLRIAYLDCVEEMPVEQVTLQISALADALIAACYDRALASVAHRRGLVPPQGGFVVFALGKLGGLELNYSSDIDLNFVYDDALARIEGSEGKPLEDPFEIERFYTQVAERLVHLVSSFTELGRLYRLDARLRPGGSSARLVWSARSSVDYYYGVGRAWERQALIRLRPVAGDFALADRMRRELEAFVFPADLTDDQIAEIRDLKLQVEKVASDRGPSQAQIKIGRGGIRDVEYIVQYLQLVCASSNEELKTANTFRALEVLDRSGLLKPEETDVLRRGYRFLRRVEHRIQMAHLQQTHRLPDDPRELWRLARSLGLPDVDSFQSQLARHSHDIRRVYGLLFEEATARREEAQELRTLLSLPPEISAKDGARVLAPFGFAEAERAFLRLHALANPLESQITLDAHRSQEVFARIVDPLLREISRQAEPDRALANFEECVRALGARSVFYELLAEDARILQLFVEISARSSLVVETLRAHPDVFDEVVDCMLTGYSFSRDSLVGGLGDILTKGGRVDPDFFKFKHIHILLIAIRDLLRLDNLSHTLLRIADLSESLLCAVLEEVLKEAHAKMGAWSAEPPRFLVLALGKLGGQEMSYKSDLDLVLIHHGEAAASGGVSSQEFFERASQMLLQACSQSDSLGPLLRVDLRLRPLGSHNSLAIASDAWKQYFRGGNARTWERQAFMRARPIAGDPGLAEEAMEFIRTELVLGGSAGPASEEALRRDVWDMRKKIESHAKPGDLKRSAGGILDVEFLVQSLQLRHGKTHPSVLTPNTATAIGTLMREKLLDDLTGSELLTSYQLLRSVENRISLVGEGSQAVETMSVRELESLVQKIGYKSSGEESALSIFRSEIDYYQKRNRTHLMRALGVS